MNNPSNESTLNNNRLKQKPAGGKNSLRKQEPNPEAQQEPKVEKVKKRKLRLRKNIRLVNKNVSFSRSVASILDGSFLTRENLLKQIPFIIFITFLGIFYIANSYNAEKTIIEIGKTKKELEELRYEYITTKSNLMFQSKQSEVAYRLVNSQVKESLVPPVKLIHKTSEK